MDKRDRKQTKYKICAVVGTRPDAIKMCPLIKELKKKETFSVSVLSTGQHREMLDGVLSELGVVPDATLDVFKEGQSLCALSARLLLSAERYLSESRPHLLLVHGDTASAFALSLAAFYLGIPTAHVEAGLRTHDLHAPFPEEFNRQAIGLTAALHFAPTEISRRNLLSEGKRGDSIFVVGNTVSDAIFETIDSNFSHPLLQKAGDRRIIFLTVHRRESIGAPMAAALSAFAEFMSKRDDLFAICPTHKNPLVRVWAEAVLGALPNVELCEPLGVRECHNLLRRSAVIVTDSGGIQEEAAILGIPALVLREVTERPEGVDSGVLRLVGRSGEDLIIELEKALKPGSAHAPSYIYGRGSASSLIAEVLEKTDFKKIGEENERGKHV